MKLLESNWQASDIENEQSRHSINLKINQTKSDYSVKKLLQAIV
jgi:hypothetical protein